MSKEIFTVKGHETKTEEFAGVKFNIQDGVLMKYTKKPGVTEVFIPDSVTSKRN